MIFNRERPTVFTSGRSITPKYEEVQRMMTWLARDFCKKKQRRYWVIPDEALDAYMSAIDWEWS